MGRQGGGIRSFPAGGGKHFFVQGGKGTVKLQKSPKNALSEGVLEMFSKYVQFCIFEAHFL